MFGNTLTITKDGVAAATLNRIGDAGDNGSRYYLREAGSDVTLTIRHTTYVDKSNSARKGVSVDRHNVEIIQRYFGANGAADTIRKTYVVIENDRTDDLLGPQTNVGYLQEFLTDTNVLKLLGWES